MTLPSAGIDSDNGGVPGRLSKCVMNVAKAGRKDVASRCFVPCEGFRMWTPPIEVRRMNFGMNLRSLLTQGIMVGEVGAECRE